MQGSIHNLYLKSIILDNKIKTLLKPFMLGSKFKRKILQNNLVYSISGSIRINVLCMLQGLYVGKSIH